MNYSDEIKSMALNLYYITQADSAMKEIKKNKKSLPEFNFLEEDENPDIWIINAIKEFDEICPNIKVSPFIKCATIKFYRKEMQIMRKEGIKFKEENDYNIAAKRAIKKLAERLPQYCDKKGEEK